MEKVKVMMKCGLCHREFQFGPGRYEGTHLSHYNLTLCEGCYKGNWDGFAPHLEEKLVAHLKEQDIPIPERNENGWYPRYNLSG